MNDIAEIHENVLQFLLDWREKKDPQLMFTLRKRPIERLEAGYWFLGNPAYLAFSFWTGMDWVNKTQSIYIEITNTGQFFLRFSAKDDRDKADVLGRAATILGGFYAHVKSNNGWSKEYEGTDYLKNLELFLNEDRERIDAFLSALRNAGYNAAFSGGVLNKLNPNAFKQSLELVQGYRKAPAQGPEIVDKLSIKDLVLKEMTVINTGLFERCTIQFGERATCLIGENGGGKTTLLRAAALGLVGTGSPLVNTQSELQNLPRITGVGENFSLNYAGNGQIQTAYKYGDKLFENGKANFIPFKPNTDSGTVEFFGDRIEDDGFGLPVDEFGTDTDGELPVLVIGYPQRYGRKPDGTNVTRRPLKPNAYDIIPLIHDIEDNRIESLRIWISETWNQGDLNRVKVRELFKIISAVLSEEDGVEFSVQLKDAYSSRKIVVTTPFNPEGIPFELLSTGLSNLFGWIGHLISRMHEAYTHSENPTGEPAIVLIDEIDNYLHPLVQARAIPVLLEAFPKVQFVFTSHSAVVLSTLQQEKVKAYRVEKGVADEIVHFYGRTIQDLLLDEYGINKRPSAKMRAKIDALFRAIGMGNKPVAQTIFDELLPVLGATDPAMEDAKFELN